MMTSLAAFDGIYRCISCDQMRHMSRGEQIADCTCGHGQWLYFKEDNANPRLLDTVSLQADGRQFIRTDDYPELNARINLLGGDYPYGLYHIEYVSQPMAGAQPQIVGIDTTRVGKLDATYVSFKVYSAGT